ncbi:MAG: hypothetical protein HY986_01930 [Candidatus Melainabacteria bacterium]|nr:hypothetical protein [Candidatus Melainabacteria bacterium]
MKLPNLFTNFFPSVKTFVGGLRYRPFMAFFVLVFLLVAYCVVMPFIQPAVFTMFRYLPLVLSLLVSGFLGYVYFRKIGSRGGFINTMVLTFLLALPGWMAVANFADVMQEWSIALTLEPRALTKPPFSTDRRSLNKATASIYAQNSNHESLLTSGHPHIAADMSDSEHPHMWWQVPFYYREGLNYYLGSVAKIVRIDADSPNMAVDLKAGEKAEFYFGEESTYVHALFALRLPFSRPSHAQYYRHADGTWSLLIPAISYRPTITGAMIPEYTKVMQVLPSGNYHVHSAADAGKLFPGAPLFPLELGRLYSASYGKFKSGLINYYDTVLGRNNIFEISEDEVAAGHVLDESQNATDNRFPFYQTFLGEGLKQMVPLEPVGPSYALSEILLFDAGTGEPSSYIPAVEDSLNAPRKAERQVWTALPTFPQDKYKAVEARFKMSKSGKYFWLFTVVNTSADKSIYAKLVLVDAKDLVPMAFDNQNQVDQFLEGAIAAPQSVPAAAPVQ